MSSDFVFVFLFLTTEGKMLIVVLSTVLCWNGLSSTRLGKVWSIFSFLLVGYDGDIILLSHIWAMSIIGGCRWVEVGRELFLLLDENWQLLGVLLSCVWCVGMSVTIFIFIILLSKLVCCCAVLCDNFEGRRGGIVRWVMFRGEVLIYWNV